MATRAEIITELKSRGVDTSNFKSTDSSTPVDSSTTINNNLILKELESRGVDTSNFKSSESEKFLQTREQQKKNDPYGMATMVDDMETAPENVQSKSVNEYLTSKKFARLALEITGGVVGAALAPAIAPAVLIGRAAMAVRPALQAAVTRMAGAGIGEATGALTSQTFDPTFNSKDNISKIMSSVAKDMLLKGAIGATGEGAGQLISKGISKVLSKNKKLLKGAEEAVETLESQKQKILKNPKNLDGTPVYSDEVIEATNFGQLTPGLLQKGQTIDILEGIAESSLLGGGKIRYAKEGASTIAQSGVDDFVNTFKTKADDAELGFLFQKTLTDDLTAFKAVGNAKYKAVDVKLSSDKFADNFQVDITNLKKFARKELQDLTKGSESNPLKSFLNGILKENNYVKFRKANILRGEYLEISRSFTGEALGKKKNRLSAIASRKISEAMDNSPIPESTKSLLAEANKHYREGAEIFNDALFKKIINNDPDLVYKSIVASGDRPTLIKKTFEILNKRITDVSERNLLKNKIRGEFLDDIIFRSQVSQGQFGVEIDGGKLFSNYRKQRKTFEAMFSSKQISDFEKFKNALVFAQGKKSKVGGLPGPMMIQMKQSGALIELGGVFTAGAGMSGTGASILLAPAIIAKAFTSPKIIRALTLGVKYSNNPTLKKRYFLQTVTAMAAEGLISKDELRDVKRDVKNMDKEKNKTKIFSAPILNETSNIETPNLNELPQDDQSFLPDLPQQNLPETPSVDVAALQPSNTTMNQDYNSLSSLEKDRLLRGIS